MNAIDKFADSLKNKPDITRDAYDMWRDNEVTRRFVADMTEWLMGYYMLDVVGDDVLVKAAKRSSAIEVLEEVIDWQPLEEK